MSLSALSHALPRGEASPRVRGEALIALVVVGLLAVRYRLPLDVPIGLVAALVVLPVSARYLSRFRGGITIAALTVTAALTGALLTAAAEPWGNTSSSLLLIQTLRILGVGVMLAAVLWARNLAGTRNTILAFGLGAGISLIVTGINLDNPWKFSLSLPVTLILLSLPVVYSRRGPQFLTAVLLATVSAVSDSRSAAGFLLIAAALTLTQPRAGTASTAARRGAIAVRVVAVAAGGFLLLQGAILEGVLGEALQSRTQAQIEAGGSVITGGRPELGASSALIASQPWGFGSGVVPSSSQIMVAKRGMARLGYDPNNGYVDNYMFGAFFELHSLLADFWIIFGVGGLALAVAILVLSLRGVIQSIATGVAATVTVYLVIRMAWDFGFSPLISSLTLLPLAIGIALTPFSAGGVEANLPHRPRRRRNWGQPR